MRCMVPQCPAQPANAEGFLCRPHWYAVPKALRDRVWALYRSAPGSEAHRQVVREAVRAASAPR